MRQTQAKLNWYKITWKWNRNKSIGDLVKDSYFGSHKGNVKTVIGNSSNSSSHDERAKAAVLGLSFPDTQFKIPFRVQRCL